jgi:hypothetical protein
MESEIVYGFKAPSSFRFAHNSAAEPPVSVEQNVKAAKDPLRWLYGADAANLRAICDDADRFSVVVLGYSIPVKAEPRRQLNNFRPKGGHERHPRAAFHATAPTEKPSGVLRGGVCFGSEFEANAAA